MAEKYLKTLYEKSFESLEQAFTQREFCVSKTLSYDLSFNLAPLHDEDHVRLYLPDHFEVVSFRRAVHRRRGFREEFTTCKLQHLERRKKIEPRSEYRKADPK